MHVEVTGHYGVDGVATRLVGRIDGARACELRVLDTTGIPDAAARVADAAHVLSDSPHPLVPRVLGTFEHGPYAVLALEPTEGRPVRDLCARPVPQDAAVAVAHTVATFLEQMRNRRDGGAFRRDIRLRSVSTVGLRVHPGHGVRWVHVETLSGSWPERAAHTTWFGEVSALPFDGTESPEDDVRDLGIVLWELLVGTRRAHATVLELLKATSADGYHQRLRGALSVQDAHPRLRTLIERMLAWHADERPPPQDVCDRLSEFLVSQAAVRDWIADRATHPPPPNSAHPLVGATLGEREPTPEPPPRQATPAGGPRPPPRPKPRPVGPSLPPIFSSTEFVQAVRPERKPVVDQPAPVVRPAAARSLPPDHRSRTTPSAVALAGCSALTLTLGIGLSAVAIVTLATLLLWG